MSLIFINKKLICQIEILILTHYAKRQGRKIVHKGITNDLERREREHQEQFPNSKISQVGNVKTREGALKWEAEQEKTITSPKKK